MSFLDLDFGLKKKTPLIRQAEASECGLACLAMVSGFHGYSLDLITLRRKFQVSLKGSTLVQILKISEELGFHGRAMRLDLPDIQQLTLPAILHWDLNHFVVLTGISSGIKGRRYNLHDPATGARVVGDAEMSQRFTGVALEISRAAHFQPAALRVPFRVKQLWSRVDGLIPSFWRVILLSIILQICALTAPFFLQVSVDTVVPTSDGDLLSVLAVGFAGVAMVSLLASWARSLVMVRLGTALSYQVVVNLFRHLLRLPLPWFERRHVGDVISRFSSVRSITDLISQGAIVILVDGLMAVAALTVVFLYSPMLGLLPVLSVASTLALRIGFFSALRRANVSVISTSARENSVFIETIRGMSTIKAHGEEANRQRIWQKRKVESVNAEIKSGQLNAGFGAGEEFIGAIERVVFLFLAIRQELSGALSVGMIFALASYRQQFFDAAIRLIQQVISYRLLDMHLARVADIALSQPEPLGTWAPANAIAEVGQAVRIEARDIRFRYAPGEPEILRGISLTIEPGELIGIVGPSGGGKTTLIKILMGLLSPTSGEILINGEPLWRYGLDRWRQATASVAQGDTLFAGTLADNISLFDADPDHDRIEAAARAVNMDADIRAMPMHYNTLVGDMGSTLSGGQRQRVMLARAIYRQPSAIFLDEVTAHLDPANEANVSQMLAELPATRISVAHRPQAIAGASRVFIVYDGELAELSATEKSHSDRHISGEIDVEKIL